MIRHKSTEKRARQNTKRYLCNRSIRSSMKTRIKNLISALETKNMDAVYPELKKVISSINRAASKGVIKKETASRKISRLTKRVNKLSVAQQ